MKLKNSIPILAIVVLTSCAHPFQSVADLKLAAASEIGIDDALPTVWNISGEPSIGSLFSMAGDPQHGYYLTYYDSIFEGTSKPFVDTSTNDAQWTKTIDDTDSIKAQLGYMGLSGSADFEGTNKITFSMDMDKLSR
jgi:hypothetical protein